MNNLVSLLRHSKSPFGAFGVLFNFDHIPFAVSLENEETLIPAGYIIPCKQDFYHHGGYPTFEIIIPGRSRLLFHKLNWDFQSQGCVGVGEAYEYLKDRPAISNSQQGFEQFWNAYKGFKEIKLVVVEFPMQQEVEEILRRQGG